MRQLSLILLLCFAGLLALPAIAAREGNRTSQATIFPRVVIQSPYPGQALQGSVLIQGSTEVPGFKAAYLQFAYTNDATHTWFLIFETTTPINFDTLALWDTTTITDGNYDLRLVVLLQDGSQQALTVKGLRVRNYSPIETDTPTPQVTNTPSSPSGGVDTGGTPTPVNTTITPPTASPTPLILTPTPLPTNPAQISTQRLLGGLVKGAIISIGLFTLLGGYLAIRAWQRRSK